MSVQTNQSRGVNLHLSHALLIRKGYLRRVTKANLVHVLIILFQNDKDNWGAGKVPSRSDVLFVFEYRTPIGISFYHSKQTSYCNTVSVTE